MIPEQIDRKSREATVYVRDIYVGDGLKGIPRGTVKQLRIVTYNFAYHGMGGLVGVVGVGEVTGNHALHRRGRPVDLIKSRAKNKDLRRPR